MRSTIKSPTTLGDTRAERGNMDLRELVELYAIECVRFKNLSPATEKNYITAINSLIHAVGVTSTDKLTYDHIKQWRFDMMSKKYSIGTVRCHLSKIKNLFIWSNGVGYTDFPVEQIQYPKQPIIPPTFIYPKDVEKLILCAENKRDKAIISMLYAAGLRSSELCDLQKESLDGNQLQIKGKGNKYRIGFIDNRTKVYLQNYLSTRSDSSVRLFVSRTGGKLTKNDLSRIVRKCTEKAKLKTKVTPHTLRHSYATNLLRNGCNLRYIQDLLGHDNIQTTILYTHVVKEDLARSYTQFHST